MAASRKRSGVRWVGSGLIALAVGCGSSGQRADAIDLPTALPASDVRAVEALFTSINSTAGGAVSAQQRVLLDSVHPDFAAGQQACASATITIKLDPVRADLMATPGWQLAAAPGPADTRTSGPALEAAAGVPASQVPRGQLFRVPALVEVYTDSRRTGTDFMMVRLAVIDGVARTFPLCLV